MSVSLKPILVDLLCMGRAAGRRLVEDLRHIVDAQQNELRLVCIAAAIGVAVVLFPWVLITLGAISLARGALDRSGASGRRDDAEEGAGVPEPMPAEPDDSGVITDAPTHS